MKSTASASGRNSREKLIQSAENLFADRGFGGVSVRDIANDAKVNSALVGYYFGNKEGLLTEVYTRHCEPLNHERSRLLAEFRAKRKNALLKQILEAFIRPTLQASQGPEEGRSFSRLRTILAAENSLLLERLVARNFDETNKLFIDALCKCLPNLTREDVLWRFHFLIGAMCYTATGPTHIQAMSNGKCNLSDPEVATDELIAFAAAGFKAPCNGLYLRGNPITKIPNANGIAKR